MISKQLLGDHYRQQAGMVAAHVGDFSEADMLVRPGEGTGNHAAWHVGHIAVTFRTLINAAMPGAIPPDDADFVTRCTGKGSKLNDGFPTKAELIRRVKDAGELAAEWVEGLNEADLVKPTPDSIRGFAPTIGHLVLVVPAHVNMHVGQIQAIRRKLGKPVLF
jgi:hypothetical protein